MSNQYLNNPLHGLKLDVLVTTVVEHYGFKILAAATNINCFKQNPSIESSIKFLKKTEWARIKLEDFYLYQYCALPKPRLSEFDIPPRERIIPEHQKVAAPIELTVDELIEQRQQREHNYQQKRQNKSPRAKSTSSRPESGKQQPAADPWAHYKKS
ncbi:VF530 family DNA-binding protein [Thalassotalea aquiviva]|uniref:VF530 family protein n=1 Tax=Thalassotalea aquiviva TaxID=3242415 RepID=UPI003529FB2E